MATVDSLEIQISAQAQRATQGIDNIIKKLGTLENKMGSPVKTTGLDDFSKKASEISKQFENADYQKSIKKLSEQFSNVGKNFKVPETLGEVQKQIEIQTKEFEKLSNKEERAIDIGAKLDSIGFKGLQRDIAENLNKLDLLIAKEKELKAVQTEKPINIQYYNQDLKERPDTPRFASLNDGIGYNAEAMENVFGEGYSSIQNWNQALTTLGSNAGSVLNGIAGKIQNINSLSVSATSVFNGLKIAFQSIPITALKIGEKALSGIISLGKKATSVIGVLLSKAFKKITSYVKNFGNQSNKAFGGGLFQILKYGLGIRSLFVLFNRLRRAIKDGFENLAQYSDETNGSISRVVSSLTQLKNSLAVAFAPIVNFVAPILTNFINLMSRAMNVFGQFVAALTGKKVVVQSLKVSQDYAAGLSKNLGNSAKNAEKAKKALTTLGIDELNINAPEDEQKGAGGSSGADGGGVSPSEMFETIDIPKDILDFVNKIKEAWKNADFTELGGILGEKLNSALESIPWDRIQDTAKKIAKSIATFLNGFIASTDWALVGETLAQGINTIIYSAYAFVENFNWSEFGKAIGEGINGFFGKLNVSVAAKSLSKTIKGLLDVAINAIKTIDWSMLAKKTEEAISNIDFSGITRKLFELLGSALGGIAEFIGTLISDAFTGAKNYFQGIADELGVDIGTGVAIGIGRFFGKAVTWIKENIFDPFIEGFKNVFGIHSPAETMKPLGENILLGVVEGFRSVFSIFTEAITEFLEVYVAPWFTLEKWTELFSNIGTSLLNTWEEVKLWWSETALVTWWEEDVAPWFTLEKWTTLLDSIKTSFKTKWDETAGKWKTDITTWWNNSVAPWFTLEKWKTMLSKVPEAFKGAFKSAVNGAIGFMNKLIGGVEKMVNNAIDAFNALVETLNPLTSVLEMAGISLSIKHVNLPRIPEFEQGGFPKSASLFWANENRVPELIGTVGGRTAVTSGTEITGIRDAVYDTAQTEAELLRTAVDLLQIISNKQFSVEIGEREFVSMYDERKARNGFSFT